MGKFKHGHAVVGQSSSTYRSWQAMRRRCYNPNDVGYSRYGGRGITVCLRWSYFENFLEDMGERPEGLTLDRLDTDGPYCKDNCRWATKAEQSVNKSNCRQITFEGKTHCISEWARKVGVGFFTLRSRLNRGWSVERALTTNVGE